MSVPKEDWEDFTSQTVGNGSSLNVENLEACFDLCRNRVEESNAWIFQTQNRRCWQVYYYEKTTMNIIV